MPDKSSSLMAGVPELVVLRLLAERDMYGYEIARALMAAAWAFTPLWISMRRRRHGRAA